jgi:hypothetical protein
MLARLILAFAFLTSATLPSFGADDVGAQRREDISVFRDRFWNVNPSLTESVRESGDATLADLAARAEEISLAEFEMTIAQLVALADNGHTSAFPSRRAFRYNTTPIRLVPFGEAFYVAHAQAAQADLLGARLVSIDGRGFGALQSAARSLMGGLPAWRDRQAPYLFQSPQQLHALGLADRPDRAEYVFEDGRGRTIRRILHALPPPPEYLFAMRWVFNERWIYPSPPPGEGEGWKSLLDERNAPWSLQERERVFRWRQDAALDALIIDMRLNIDSETESLDAFFAEVIEVQRVSSRANVVVDMRLNGGGDLNTTRAFMQKIPALFPGRLFVITSPWTFSAGIASVAYLEQAAPDRVTIVGEAVGDRLDFRGDGDIITLPHSGIMLLNARARHDYWNGCVAAPDCQPTVAANPIAVESLAPDIVAPWTIDAYVRGVDPAIAAIAAAIRR